MVGTIREHGAIDQHDFIAAAQSLVDAELKVHIAGEKHLEIRSSQRIQEFFSGATEIFHISEGGYWIHIY